MKDEFFVPRKRKVIADKYIVYQLLLPNGKSYIGYTQRNFFRRYLGHITKNNKSEIAKAIAFFGHENITAKILARCPTATEALRLEKYYIVKLNTRVPNGYNVSTGGEIGSVGRRRRYRRKVM